MAAAAQRKPETTGFRIDGEWITEIVRTRILEGHWDWSWRLLMENLHGMTADIALKILRGDAKLVGVNTVDLADDDDQEHKRQFAWMFDGVYSTSDGRFIRPYAVVTSWGPEDMYSKDTTSTPGSDVMRRRSGLGGDKVDYGFRSLFYANDRKLDVLRAIKLPNDYVTRYGLPPTRKYDVLFHEVRNYPSILAKRTVLNDAQGAVDGYLAAGGRLEERGYCRSFPADLYKIRQETKVDEEPALKKTMSRPSEPEDVDILLDFQRAEQAAGREKTAAEITKALNEAAAVASDFNQPMAARLQAWAQHETSQRDARERISDYRRMIEQQAGDNVFDLTYMDGKRKRIVKVPRAPFDRWALNSTAWFHLGPEWQPVCPQGLKMFGDDPFHSDWIIGAGIDPADWDPFDPVEDGLKSAAFEEMHKVQERYFNAKVPVLCGSGATTGKVVHIKKGERLAGRGIIAVIPNAGPDFVEVAQEVMEQGGALITEAGGVVAHLVTVFRDKDLKIIRVPDARKLYPQGRWVTVDCTAGEITLSNRGGAMRLANGVILPLDDD